MCEIILQLLVIVQNKKKTYSLPFIQSSQRSFDQPVNHEVSQSAGRDISLVDSRH